MNIWRLIKLNFGRNLAHFGELGIGIEESSERVRSDTLFSAWMSAYARLFGKLAVENLFEQLPKDQPNQSPTVSPFLLSSTFVYQQHDDQTVYYVPRPLKFPLNYPIGDDLNFAKTYKSLKFLPLQVWQRWYQGTGFTKSDREELVAKTKGEQSKSTALAVTKAFEYSKAFEFHKIPKIAVDRTSRATNFYYTGFVQFQWEHNPSGLYFLICFSNADSELEANLQAALLFLGEEGLGGERSSGAGRFVVDWQTLPEIWKSVVQFSDSQYHSLISIFWDDTINSDFLLNASYELQERGGWIVSPFSGRQLRRQAVQVFTEGSVFAALPRGKLATVTPDGFRDHAIYRSGISLSLPIQAQDHRL
jgi:CRISPR-associated protein Csm4